MPSFAKKRGDYVILKRYLTKNGEISKKARIGTVRNISTKGAEVDWTRKSDKKLSIVRKTHNLNSLHGVDSTVAKKTIQFLHKHISKSAQPAEISPPSETPPSLSGETPTE